MKSSHRKRAPFGEAPADLGNRRGGAAADDGGARGGGGGRTRAAPPSTIVSKSKPRRSAAAPVPSVLVKSGTHRSKSRDRRPSSQHHHRRDPQQQQQQQRDPSQSQSPERSTSTADAHANPKEDDASRARLYKAEAYEAKVRLASRDQRIDALQAELEEVRLFQKVEHDASAVRRDAARRDADERAGRKKSDDAELIEALAQELETMEGDLHAAQDRLRGAEKDVAERRRAEADVRAALAAQEVQSEDREADLGRQLKESRMLLERQERDLWAKFESEHQNRVSEAVSEEQAQWKKRESDLKGSIERLQVELTQANNDAKEGCAILKELHGELRKARNERDDLRSQASTLRDARSDAEEAARSARAEADDRAARCDNLEKSNKELQGVLVTIQGQSAKKVEQVRREVAEARAREEALRDENRALVEAHEREVAEARAREEALREENRALVEAREKEEERTKEACDREEALINDYNVLVEAHEQEEERAKAAEEKLKEAEERTKEACAREEALRNDHDVMVQRAQEMEELETDLGELAKNCDEQEKELSSKAAAIEELQSNVERLKREHAAEIEATKENQCSIDELEKLKQELSSREDAIKELGANVERLEQERENDVEKLRAKEREMEELQSALDATESQSKEEIEQLENQVLSLKKDHERLSEKHEQELNESQEMENHLEHLIDKCEEQEKELSARAAAIDDLKEAHAANTKRLELEHATEMKKLTDNQRSVELLETSNEELQNALDTLHNQSEKRIRQLEDEVSDLEAAEERIRQLEDEISDFEAMKKEHDCLLEKHEQGLNELQEMDTYVQELETKCDEQEKELSTQAAAMEEAERSHASDIEKLQGMDTYVQELETKCDEQEKELETQAAAMEEAERLHASDIEKREKKISKQAAAMEKLKEALADNLNKLDMAYAKDMEKFKDSERDLHSLDKANKDLQNELDSMKTQSSKEINQLKFDALEAQAREKALKQDHRSLVERYGAEMKKVQDMASDIEDLAKTCDEQEEELSKQAAAMDELKRLHASNIEKLEMEHAIEIDQKKGLRHDVASLEKANNELQDALESMKSLSGKEIDQLKFDVLEAQSREKVLAQDHKLAVVRYEAEIEKLDLARANAVDKIKVHEKANDELRNALDSMKDMSGKEIDQLKFEILEAQSREKALMQDHKSAAEEYEAEIKELDVLHAKDVTKIKGDMASLEKANKDLQDSLESMKSLSGKEIDQLKFEILEAQSREKALARDRNNLVERYETERKRNEYMKSNLDVMSKKYHEQEMDTSNHGTAMDELKEMHASNIERLELEHALEIEQMKRIERDLETLQKANKEQEEKLSNQDSAIWASKDSHATNVASIKCGYELDIEKMLQNESSLKTRHVRELKMKDDLRKSREAYWESRLEDLRAAKHESSEASESNYIAEIKVLKDSMTSVRTDMESQLDKLRSENSKLRTENDDLSQKLHRGLGIHKRTATDLEAKTLELNKLQTNAERVKAEVEEFDSLKKDYASAVELSISRGKKIQSLEQDVETYYSKLAKTIQKMKNMDSNSSSNELLEEEVSSLRLKARESENKISSLKQELQLAEESARASERLQAEVSSLRSKAMESEERISELMEELQCYDQTDEINERLREELSSLRAKDLESNQMIAELEDQLLFVDQLDRDLTGARKENDLLQSKVRYLEEALRDASAALKVVSSQKKPSPRKSNPRDHEDMLRRQIEESALQEYYAQRMQR